jgi:hypothetical protein
MSTPGADLDILQLSKRARSMRVLLYIILQLLRLSIQVGDGPVVH